MALNRRQLLGTAAAAAAMTQVPRAYAQSDSIVVSSIYDQSGGLDVYGKPVADLVRFAVAEQNAKGGLLGKEIVLKEYDPQSNNQLYAQFAKRTALADKPAAVFAGITSSSREVVRPILRQAKTLYFYTTQYEGGVCDRNIFCTGVTPAQTVQKLVNHTMAKTGKKAYIVAADYNYGQITADWVKKFTLDNGGEVLNTEFFPLDVADFGSSISKIQAANPDFVYSALVGGAHMSFYRQWKAAGMLGKIQLSSTTFAGGNEHIALPAEEYNGHWICQNYLQELPGERNKKLVADFHKMFGEDYPYITELGMGAYQAFLLWAAAVEKAGTVDRMAVIEALETGISVDAPSGRVTVDPATHHTIVDVHVSEARDKQLNLIEKFEQQPPADTSAVCDLINNPDDNQQYVIEL
ncbi:transporter substrate-binding protein [Hoeflea poritis]|uniref:Transporter substrate-binding protein n=1 Tax=Hoeflea poritis TaxID=2993659 RepID=A0ABT4VVF6_9HYPH|nr:transporter substrate-binding protein [Hoeflea poritis]MDA4848706.1 transporter substrate-binding protein [Hoeflea poritis]